MTVSEAVERFIFDGASIGVGGQNVIGSPMAIAHEIIRQRKKNLTLLGCNLSIAADILIGAGLVKKCECGSCNIGFHGIPRMAYSARKYYEEGKLEIEDYDHLIMVSRFLAGEMGLPFMPVMSSLGSDILKYKAPSTEKKFEIIENPWNSGEKVVLVPAATPDVAIVHVPKVDELGNIIREGFIAHMPEMVRASEKAIVSCEEIISSEKTRNHPEMTAISHIYVSAIVEQPWGSHPTATLPYYDCDVEHLRMYQECAEAALKEGKVGRERYQHYLQEYVLSCATFDDYLEKVGGVSRLKELKRLMREVF
jgi:acyl CoA:acetate/3-ketoacid CoA transferase alpha subunit